MNNLEKIQINPTYSFGIAKKKIIDFTHLERFTECVVCLEQYKEPRILPCSHTYCTTCLNELIVYDSNSSNQKLACPQCKLEHILSDQSIENSFPRNLAIEQLLDIKPTQLISDKYCEACDECFAFTNCLHCSKSVCLECKTIHLIEYKNKLQENVLNFNKKYQNFITNFKKRIKEFLVSSSETKKLIKLYFNELILEIKNQQDQLCKNVDCLVQENMNLFNSVQESFLEKSSNIKSFIANTTTLLQNDSITDDDLVELEKEHLKHEMNFENFQHLNGNELKKLELEISSDMIFELKNSIKNLGKIVIKISKNDLNEKELINDKPKIFLNTNQNAQNKSNLELVKQSGLWKGDEYSKYWCPSGLAFNSSKNEIVIADSFNHELKIIDANDASIKRSSFDKNKNEFLIKLKTPRDLCFNSAEQLIVTDSGNNRCCLIDYNNFNLILEFGGSCDTTENLNDPRGVCVDSYHRIYVCDRNNHRIQVFNSNGKFLKHVGSNGTSNGEFSYPEYVCVSNSSQLIVSDTNNHRIQIFDIKSKDTTLEEFGSFILSFGTYGTNLGCFRYPKGISTDSEGFIMVCDWKNDRLQLFDPKGNFVTEISSHKNNLNKLIDFEKPVGISILSDGSLAISTWGRSQNVQIL